MSKKATIEVIRKSDGVTRFFTPQQWSNLTLTNNDGNYRVVSGKPSNARPAFVSKEILDLIEEQENAEQTESGE